MKIQLNCRSAAIAVSIYSILFNVVPSQADTNVPSTSGTNEDPTVITVTKTAVPQSKLGSSFTRIGDAEIERNQFENLGQAVNTVPGVTEFSAGATGGYPTLSIRGNRTSDTLLLVDGVSVNTGINQDAHPFLAYLGTDNLRGIDVVRGPQSTLYGSSGIGGVISLETMPGCGRPTGDLFFEAGSFNTTREGISSSGGLGNGQNLGYSLSYEREDSTNYRPNNDLAVNRYTLRLDSIVSDAFTLRFNVRGVDGNYQEPGSQRPQDWASNDPEAYSHGSGTVMSLMANLRTSDIWTQKLTLGGYIERYTFNDPAFAGNFFTPTNYWSYARNLTADWLNTFQAAANNRVSAGITYNITAGQDNTFNPQSMGSFAFYAQDEWEVVKNLNLTGGARFEEFQGVQSAFTYRFTGSYLWDVTNTKLHSSVGTAFKAPSLYQRYSTSAFAVGNPLLSPEKSIGWDIGLEQPFLENNLVFGVTYFQNRIRDLLNFVPTSFVTGYYENQNTASNNGVEVSAESNLLKGWKTRVAYTYTDSTATNNGVTQRRDNIPLNKVSMDSSYVLKDRWTIGMGASYVAGRVSTDFSVFPSSQVWLHDYFTARLFTRYDLNQNLSISARAENLTNAHYETSLGYPGLPFGAFGGVELKF